VRVGDLSPMALLWTFMEYSRPYAFFGGLMELVAIVLLCFRRTATLGALVCLAVMMNVALLNYAYGVPVKLYATMITVSAAVLVLYDTRRLWDFFVRNRAVDVDHSSTWLQDRIPAGWRHAIKIVGVGSVALSSIVAMAPTLHNAEPGGVQGTWKVSDATSPWLQLMVTANGFAIRTVRDSTIRCARKPGGSGSDISLKCGGASSAQLQLTAVQDTLRVDGTFDDAPVHVTATRVRRESYNLMRRKFQWIID